MTTYNLMNVPAYVSLVQAAIISSYKNAAIREYFTRVAQRVRTGTRHQDENESQAGGEVAGGGLDSDET